MKLVDNARPYHTSLVGQNNIRDTLDYRGKHIAARARIGRLTLVQTTSLKVFRNVLPSFSNQLCGGHPLGSVTTL